jgi:hypothetical protein
LGRIERRHQRARIATRPPECGPRSPTRAKSCVNIGDHAATGIPDIVGSLRVDQAWGSAQIAGALHQLRAVYYGKQTRPAPAPNVLGVTTASLPQRCVRLGGDGWHRPEHPWNKGDKF